MVFMCRVDVSLYDIARIIMKASCCLPPPEAGGMAWSEAACGSSFVTGAGGVLRFMVMRYDCTTLDNMNLTTLPCAQV